MSTSPEGLNRSDADAVLKDFYLPGIRKILNSKVFLLSQMEENYEDVEGRAAVLSVNVGRNQGVGARGENETLPTPGAQQYAEQRVPLKYNYGRIRMSGPVIRSMGSDRGSFTRAIQSETSGIVRDLRNDVNRQTYGTGTGQIALVSTGQASAIILLVGAGPQVMRQFGPGMLVDISSDLAAAPHEVGARIVSVDRAAETITVDASFTSVTGDVVGRSGSLADGTTIAQKEITGLDAQVAATGALWGIDPANWPDWASYVLATAGAATEDMFIEVDQEVGLDSGEQMDTWVTTAQVHRWVAGLLTSLKRFPTTNEMKGGYSGLDITDMSQGNDGANTVNMVYDKDMTEVGAAYGLTMSRWQCYKMSDWEFMQEDGAILNRVPNVDAYEGTLFCYMEMATDARNAHGKIEGITDPAA